MSKAGFALEPHHVDTKAKFVAKLRDFVKNEGRTTDDGYDRGLSYNPARGEITLIQGLADYLDAHSEIPEEKYGNWLNDLPEYLIVAFEDMRNNKALNKAYHLETGYPIPDLLDIQTGTHRALVIYSLARLLPILGGQMAGTWLEHHIEAVVYAKDRAIDQAWRRFVRVCYRTGLAERTKTESHRGNSGVFGKTTLMNYSMAGRCMYTFQRGPKNNRRSVSFVADESDMYGNRSGMNTPHAEYLECIEMIEEVTDNWDLKQFRPDKEIGLG